MKSAMRMKSALRRIKKSGFHFTLGISRGLHLNEVKISSKLAWISSAVADFIEFLYDKLMFSGEVATNESLPPGGRGTTKWWKEPAGW